MTVSTLEANECRFHVEIDGPPGAPWLVLSHSLGSSGGMWQPQVAAFAQQYRVLRYDTRGHGRTTVTSGPYAIAQLGEDVVGLLDVVGVERAHFCGLSMGGATGIWLATHAPERFGRFVFCDTAPWLGPPQAMLTRAEQVRREGLDGLADPTMGRWFTAAFRARDPQTVDAIRAAFLATPADGYAACCEALAGFDERANLQRIDRPVLVIAGTEDPSPPLETARAYAVQIPGAQFVELPAAHLTNLGAAQDFNAAVLRFLGEDGA
jgi:3-oxoadipate enol-lactonase